MVGLPTVCSTFGLLRLWVKGSSLILFDGLDELGLELTRSTGFRSMSAGMILSFCKTS
jgi:hypothetical protein